MFYFPDDRRHLSPDNHLSGEVKGGSDEQAQREAVTETAAAWALSQPLAQWAAFSFRRRLAVAQYDRLSGRRDESVFNLLLVCVLLTWLVYGRRKFSQK